MDDPLYLMVDNGSLRPEATLSLRALALSLSARVGLEVHPVSLLHSSAVDPEKLYGVRADIFEPWMKKKLQEGHRSFVMIPLFFGPTRAITQYVPERLAFLREKYGEFEFKVAPMVGGMDVHSPEPRLSQILIDLIERTEREKQLSPRTPVVLVDHGSPAREVTVLRDSLGIRLREHFEGHRVVIASSMERREGEEYAFNEPLLEKALLDKRLQGAHEVIVSMLFLQPGRHAGKNGDVAEICREVCKQIPGMTTYMTPLVGEHPLLLDILVDRVNGVRV